MDQTVPEENMEGEAVPLQQGESNDLYGEIVELGVSKNAYPAQRGSLPSN